MTVEVRTILNTQGLFVVETKDVPKKRKDGVKTRYIRYNPRTQEHELCDRAGKTK